MRRALPLLLAWLLWPTAAAAHALYAECTLKGGTVEVVAAFDDDSPAANAQVRVFDAGRQVIANGRTDVAGRWAFPAPPPGAYEVVVDAGAGHRLTERVTIPAATTAPTTLTERPGRPWLKLLIGLLVIGGLGGALVVVSRLRKSRRG